MTDEAGLRDELYAAIEGLTDKQARLLLRWARMLRQERGGPVEELSASPLADLLGIVHEVWEPGRSRLRLTVDASWHNPNGVLHGGVIYTMIDSGMGIAVSSALGEGEACLTIEVKISYLAPVREGTLRAETEVVKQGRNIAFTESKVTNDQGRLVATASGSMFIMRFGAAE